jgi:GH15 family glucan-1,4-alpha-glucosidase
MKKIFLPSVALGNSRSLATLGHAGEISAFFYPRIDFAKNVRAAMTALYFREGGNPPLAWCFGDCWERHQQFLGATTIVRTTLTHRHHAITFETTDLLPPGEHALVRRLRVRRGPRAPSVVLYHYFDLVPNDMPDRNAVQLLPQARVVVQHFRDVTLGITADRPFGIMTGLVPKRGLSLVKKAMDRGEMAGSDQCIGNVDFALAFNLAEETDCSVTITLAAGRTRPEARDHAARLRSIPFGDLQARTQQRCAEILAHAVPCQSPDLAEPYQRAALSLIDLFDETEGTFIAAPEFDPGFIYSGGYGYCWPRDAAVCALAAARAGFLDVAERFFDWVGRVQLESGHWYQRYWTDGHPAPSWCVRDDEIQLDQTCAMLHAAGQFARLLDERRGAASLTRDAFVQRWRLHAVRAVDAIRRHLTEDGLHRQAFDLWECSLGCFAYTMGGVIAALAEARDVWSLQVPDLAVIRRALFERFWFPDRRAWARRIDPDGRVDHTLDSSALGLIEPWRILDLSDEEMASYAEATVDTVATRLTSDTPGGPAILRFQNEAYMGGGPGCVNTLWLALCQLRLADAASSDGKRRSHIDHALANIRVALSNTNPAGQLPELVPRTTFDYWAAPHAWTSALLIECVLALNEL